MPRTVTLLFLALVAPNFLAAQRPFGAGLEVQGYPAGGIFTAQLEAGRGARWALLVSGGVNLTDRGDFGEHDDEEGEGGGGGIALRYHPRGSGRGWFVGARADLWRLSIDWTDPGRSGNTKVTVLQPTGLAGYRFPVGGGMVLDVSAALGAEINVRTNGEDVGDGAIVLLGVALRSGR